MQESGSERADHRAAEERRIMQGEHGPCKSASGVKHQHRAEHGE
jgi:hypothetical protein